MAEVSDIVTALKSRISTTLGGSFSEMGYTVDPARNSFKGNASRYGVLAGAMTEDTSENRITGSITVDQEFIIKLTDSYATGRGGDSNQTTAADSLNEHLFNIYKDLGSLQGGLTASVILIDEFAAREPEYLDGSNVVVATATIIITHRKST